jgi:DNA invertase Pin-like site-specific DNA recombinase
MRVVGFYRVSTDAQVESGLGLEAQRSAVEAYCITQGYELVAHFTEGGVSGKTPLADRKELLRALASVKTLEADALVVAKLDRLSRDPLTQMTAERVLAKAGARVVSVAGEGTEGEDPAQVLLRRIMGAVAEAEASFTGARVKEAPFGFQLRQGGGGLTPDKHFPEALRVMELRDQGLTYKSIGQETGFTQNKVFRIVSRWGDASSLLERAQGYE